PRPPRPPSARATGTTELRLRSARAFAAVAIFEPDDVVELGRRDLEDVDVRRGDHAVNRSRRDVVRVALAHAHGFHALLRADLEIQLALPHEDGLVLLHVILARELLALLDVQDLPDV